MNDANIVGLQCKLLDVVKILHDVCSQNKIKYYMIGGTMLGAFRHRGFIPWDDDIDIGLPRNDYERFISLPQEVWPSHIYLKTFRNSKDLIFPYSKLINKRTTLIEDRLKGIVGGIYIDIFPLDGVGDLSLSSKLHYYRLYWNIGLLYNNQDHGTKKTLLRRMVQWYARKRNLEVLYKNVEKRLKKKEFDSSRFVGNLVGAWGVKEIVHKEFLGIPTLYKFEDTQLFGPENADQYLKYIYGNYMEIPPLEKQKSHHRFLYLDLNTPYEEYIENTSLTSLI